MNVGWFVILEHVSLAAGRPSVIHMEIGAEARGAA
jgi:hypothetical protein